MKKRFLVRIIAFISVLICTFGMMGCNENNSYENKNSEELKVRNMFGDFGSYSEDTYTFRKYNTISGCNFLYSFSYNPTKKLYHCSTLVTTNGNYKLYDYGSVTFSWGDIKNALFYGYHELENIAVIELTFSNIILNTNMVLGDTYSYKITKNTFVNLNKKEDIDEYASVMFSGINAAIEYAQSILYLYTDHIELW